MNYSYLSEVFLNPIDSILFLFLNQTEKHFLVFENRITKIIQDIFRKNQYQFLFFCKSYKEFNLEQPKGLFSTLDNVKKSSRINASLR